MVNNYELLATDNWQLTTVNRLLPSTSVESPLQISSFLTNKANFPDAQMNVNKVLTKDYENISNWKLGENKANSKPNKANFRKAKMNVTTFLTKEYENISNWTLFENKVNSKPIQTQTKPISIPSPLRLLQLFAVGCRKEEIMFKRAICLMYISVCIALSGCQMREAQVRYIADWDSLKKHNAAPDWFRDAKFGIYFHWGVYTVPAFGDEWYPRNMHRKKDVDGTEYRHHIDTYGDPSKFGYHDFVPMFKAEKFNADQWAELFEQAGARFAGPVAEHHDGFSMWDSEVTPWNAADMGPKRDITGELAAAFRKRGMRLITTFHHARNRTWYPRVQGWPTTSDDPKLQMLYGNMPEKQFNRMWLTKLIEVVDKYRPDIIWFDSNMDLIPDEYRTEFLAHYFNKADKWGKQVVVTYKEQCLDREIGVEDFERGRENRITDFVWLTDDTISLGSWCYTHDLKIKSPRYVLHMLIDIVSKNGQLLLNISPKADGTIPTNQRQVLLRIGDWLGKYGEAIYGTRPFIVFGQGPTRLKTGGEFAREKLLYKPEDIRFTTKGNTVYAIGLGWPGAKHETLLKSFSQEWWQEGLKIKSVTMLGSDEKIAWSLREDGLAVTSPLSPPDRMAVVYKIETNGIEHFRMSPLPAGQSTSLTTYQNALKP